MEIVVLLLTLQSLHDGQKMNTGKEFTAISYARLARNIPKAKNLCLKRTNWILPHIVWETPRSGAPTFYTDASQP